MKIIKTVPISEYVTLKMEVDRLTDLVTELTGKLSKVQAKQGASPQLEKGIVISSGGHSKYIKVSDIVMIKAESNYSMIHVISGESYFTSKTVKYWTEKCNAPYLYRVHKSYLINSKMIESFELSKGKIYLKTGITARYTEMGRKVLTGLKG